MASLVSQSTRKRQNAESKITAQHIEKSMGVKSWQQSLKGRKPAADLKFDSSKMATNRPPKNKRHWDIMIWIGAGPPSA